MRPFRPAAVDPAEDGHPGGEQFISIGKPGSGVGVMAQQGQRRMEELVEDVLPYMSAEDLGLDVIDPGLMKTAGPMGDGTYQAVTLSGTHPVVKTIESQGHGVHTGPVGKITGLRYAIGIPSRDRQGLGHGMAPVAVVRPEPVCLADQRDTRQQPFSKVDDDILTQFFQLCRIR